MNPEALIRRCRCRSSNRMHADVLGLITGATVVQAVQAVQPLRSARSVIHEDLVTGQSKRQVNVRHGSFLTLTPATLQHVRDT
jgi:hypothetical protein